MRVEVDIPVTMLYHISDYLAVRTLEIDCYPERTTVADQALSLLLCAGKKAIREARKSKISAKFVTTNPANPDELVGTFSGKKRGPRTINFSKRDVK